MLFADLVLQKCGLKAVDNTNVRGGWVVVVVVVSVACFIYKGPQSVGKAK